MQAKANQALSGTFPVTDDGALVDADALPTGQLYTNGVADVATITITNISTGKYRWQMTVPADLSEGDRIEVQISATIATVNTAGTVYEATIVGRFPTEQATEDVQTLLDYGGAIWVDPDGGTDDATSGSYGKQSAPCQTWANVASLLVARDLHKVRVVGSGILSMTSMPVNNLLIHVDHHCTIRTNGTVTTPTGSRLEVMGGGSFNLGGTWTIGQSAVIRIRDSRNTSGSISGNATSSRFEIENSELISTLTLTGFTEWQATKCWSLHTGSGYPTIAFTSGHGTVTEWEGGLTLNSTGTGHAHLTGRTPSLTVSGTGGSVELTGEFGSITDSSGGAVTITQTGVTAKEESVQTLLTRIPAALFTGITSLAAWLGTLFGKTADAGTLAEINATTGGTSFNNADHSPEAIRIRGDAAWTTGAGGGGGEAGGVSVTIPLEDQDGNPIGDARVWITSDSDGDTLVDGAYRTDASGEVTFTLIAGTTYYLWAQKDGQQAVEGQSFVAVADA
jgi:hypothetical protein